MEYILVIIVVLANGTAMGTNIATFPTMNECFEERELVVEDIGRPIVNYQVICVKSERGHHGKE